jgi:hypothetical protein
VWKADINNLPFAREGRGRADCETRFQFSCLARKERQVVEQKVMKEKKRNFRQGGEAES